MTSSTCFCSPISPTKLDSLMVVWDATELSFDCQNECFANVPHTGVSDVLRSSREVVHRRAPQFRPIIIVSIGARPFHSHLTRTSSRTIERRCQSGRLLGLSKAGSWGIERRGNFITQKTFRVERCARQGSFSALFDGNPPLNQTGVF